MRRVLWSSTSVGAVTGTAKEAIKIKPKSRTPAPMKKGCLPSPSVPLIHFWSWVTAVSTILSSSHPLCVVSSPSHDACPPGGKPLLSPPHGHLLNSPAHGSDHDLGWS